MCEGNSRNSVWREEGYVIGGGCDMGEDVVEWGEGI